MPDQRSVASGVITATLISSPINNISIIQKCIIVSFFAYLRCSMKRHNPLYRVHIALVLLISFAATFFPFEFFHTHNTVSLCADKSGSDGFCNHKSHLGTRETYCWACTIHVEKTYALATAAPVTSLFADISFRNFSAVNTCAVTHIRTSLRGPPTCAIA
jgi:hypothetical protein